MAELISSQQTLSQTADGVLFANLSENQTAADYIGYLVLQESGLEAALAARAAVMAGEGFSVSTTQVAAQTKSATEAGSLTDIVDKSPTAMFSFGGKEYDISSILQSKVYYWSNTTGAGKKAETTYHLREVFDDVGAKPAEYDDNWFATNSPPTAEAIEIGFNETASTFVNHVRTNTDQDLKTVDLLSTANDPDGDDLTVANFKFDGSTVRPSYITIGEDGVLLIDVNSRDFDSLKIGVTKTIVVEYDIIDEHGAVTPNTATITITGTADEAPGTAEGTVSTTHYRSDGGTGNNGGNINGNVLVVAPNGEMPADAFDFSNYRDGSITVTQSGLTGNQNAKVSDSGSIDWTTGTLQVDSNDTLDSSILTANALADGSVDYNVAFNKADDSDSITVTLNYKYDYWFME